MDRPPSWESKTDLWIGQSLASQFNVNSAAARVRKRDWRFARKKRAIPESKLESLGSDGSISSDFGAI